MPKILFCPPFCRLHNPCLPTRLRAKKTSRSIAVGRRITCSGARNAVLTTKAKLRNVSILGTPTGGDDRDDLSCARHALHRARVKAARGQRQHEVLVGKRCGLACPTNAAAPPERLFGSRLKAYRLAFSVTDIWALSLTSLPFTGSVSKRADRPPAR